MRGVDNGKIRNMIKRYNSSIQTYFEQKYETICPCKAENVLKLLRDETKKLEKIAKNDDMELFQLFLKNSSKKFIDEVCEMLKILCVCDGGLLDATDGSTLLRYQFRSTKALTEWNELYKCGEIEETLNKLFNTEEVLHACGLTSIHIGCNMDDEEIRMSLKSLGIVTIIYKL